MRTGKILLPLLCLMALFCAAGCQPADTAGDDGAVHYGYTGSRPAACAACEE